MNFVKEINCGDHFYGIDKDNNLYVKGKNYYNILGIPDYKPVEEWKKIDNKELVENVQEVFVKNNKEGKNSNFVFLLTKDHNLYCSGDNAWNQTGINSSKKIEVKNPKKYVDGRERYEISSLTINRLFEWTKLTNETSEWPIERNVKRVAITSDKSAYLETMDGKVLKSGMENGGYILSKWSIVYPYDPIAAKKLINSYFENDNVV